MHIHNTGEGKFVHKNRGNRETVHSDFWHGNRRKYIALTLLTTTLLGVAFLGNLSYLFGSAFSLGVNVHHFRIIHVDYDDGAVSRSLAAAYNSLKGNGFPTIETVSASQFPTEQALRNEVCRNRHIFGAIYTHAGASERLSSAIAGRAAAQTYNASEAITFIWNGVRYSTFAQASVYSPLQTLMSTAGGVYRTMNATYIHDNLDLTSRGAIAASANPILPSNFDIMPTTQGVKAFYNTVIIVFMVISQFFYVMALNGISASFGIFTRLSLWSNLRIRYGSSLIWSAVIGSVITGVIWAYRQSWPVTHAAGVETWFVIMMACFIHFLVFDTATGFIPAQFMPYFALTWIILNVTSAIMPLELAPGFYKWHYALPSYELYQLLITIWSRGCANSTAIAVPVLFAWVILGLLGSWASMIQKCNAATKLEDEEDQILGELDGDTEGSDVETSLEKTKTAIDEEEISGAAAVPTNSRPVAHRQVSRAELRRLEEMPVPLTYSLKTPFQDSLGLTPVKTAPAESRARTMRRTVSSAAA